MAEAADRSPGGRLGPIDLTLGPMSANHRGLRWCQGQTALMRIPWGAYSMAALVVSPITPCFDAV
jgi:hypothetical protein